jgi:hypothetical protein
MVTATPSIDDKKSINQRMVDLAKNRPRSSVTPVSIDGIKSGMLSKLVSQSLKPSPYSGIVYNKKMKEFSEKQILESKKISTKLNQSNLNDVSNLKKQNVITASLKNIFKFNAESLKKPNLTTKKLDNLIRSNGEQNIKQIVTNDVLKRILETDKESLSEKEKANKKGGGNILGWITTPFKMIKEMLGDVPFVGGILKFLPTLIGGILAFPFVKKLFSTFIEGPAFTKLKEDLFKLFPFTKDIAKGAGDFFKNPLDFVVTRIGLLFDTVYDRFTNDFINPIVYQISILGDKVIHGITNVLPKFMGGTTGPFVENAEKRQAYEAKQKKFKPLGETIGDILAGRKSEAINETAVVATITKKLKTKQDAATYNINKSLFSTMADKISRKYDINPNVVKGIISKESSFNPNAMNAGSSAVGLMQVTKAARKDQASITGLKINPKGDPMIFDPETNIVMGTGYLKWLEKYLKSKGVYSEVNLIGAYNAGPGAINTKTGEIQNTKTQSADVTKEYIADVYRRMGKVTSQSKENERLNKTMDEIKAMSQEKDAATLLHQQSLLQKLDGIQSAMKENTEATNKQKMSTINKITTNLAG